MQNKILGLFTILFLIGIKSSAIAQTPSHTSTGMKNFQEEKTMKDETIGLAPQIGAVSFKDKNGKADGRQLAGLGVNINFASLYKNIVRDYYFGISTGAFYSHLGATGSNFFGSSDQENEGGSNLLMIPADLKIGYNFTSSFRACLHGGGNLIYRSIANSAKLGEGSDGTIALWRIYPNVGADFEFQLGRRVSLIARPDLTIAPNNNLFMGTVGATIIMSL